MRRLKPLDHAARSLRGARGFGGQSRVFLSRHFVPWLTRSSMAVRASPTSLDRRLDEPVVSLSGAGGGLWPGVGRRFRHAGQNRLGKSVDQGEEACCPRSTRKMSARHHRSLLQSAPRCGHLRSSFNSFRIAPGRTHWDLRSPRLRRRVDLMLLFAAEPDPILALRAAPACCRMNCPLN